MHSASSELLQFKECARHIWNTYFVRLAKSDIEAGFRFDSIEAALFRALVIEPLGLDWSGTYRTDPVPQILVSLKSEKDAVLCYETEDIEPGKNRRWVVVEPTMNGRLPPLEFVAFFGWNSFEYSDLAYVECFARSDKKIYLIDHEHCNFELTK